MQTLIQNSLGSQLRVGLSEMPGTSHRPPGEGLFAGARGEDRRVTVFRKGDVVIPQVMGTLAMRMQRDDCHYRNWLVDGDCFTGLADDTKIIWFGAGVGVDVTEEENSTQVNVTEDSRPDQRTTVARGVELGYFPDGYAYYMRPSKTGNVSVKVEVNAEGLDEGRPIDETTVQCQVVAKESIQAGTELFWFKEERIGDEVEEEEDEEDEEDEIVLQKPFSSEEDSPIARKCISRLTGAAPSSLTEMPAREFHQQRLQKWFTFPDRTYTFSDAEVKIKDKYARGSNNRFLLNNAMDDMGESSGKEVLVACFKCKLEGRKNLLAVLGDLIGVIRNIPKANQILSGDEVKPCVLSDLYQFCCVNGLINPDSDPSSIPLQWLAKVMKKPGASEETKTWYKQLLAKHVLSALVYPEFDSKELVTSLKELGVPNPLLAGIDETSSWTTNDLVSLTGMVFHHEWNSQQKKDVIERYTENTLSETNQQSRLIRAWAVQGDLAAIKAIVLKRLRNKTTKEGVIEQLNEYGIPLVVNHENCVADSQNLFKFVKEHLSEQRLQLPGYKWCTNQELIRYLGNKKKRDTAVNSEVCKRLRSEQEGRCELLTAYLQASVGDVCKKGVRRVCLSTLLRQLGDARIMDDNGDAFTLENLLPYLNKSQEVYFNRYLKKKK